MQGHTVHQFDSELAHVQTKMLEMGTLVLNQTRDALQALGERAPNLARRVIQHEHDVDVMEVRIDEDIIAILARRCPVAKDLRVIMSMSKAVTDLERIGDEAARIASIAQSLDHGYPNELLRREIHTMGKLSEHMLRKALQVFDERDQRGAAAVAFEQSRLDAEFQSSLRRLATLVLNEACSLGPAIHVVQVIKALERIGDHARNLAEYVVYMISGDDIRHQSIT